MRRFILPLVLVAVVVTINVFCTGNKNDNKSQKVKTYFIEELNKFGLLKDTLLTQVQKGENIEILRATFKKCRAQYKKGEFFIEYFYPTSALLLNGPPIDEIELGENMIIPPAGLQVIEELLYADKLNETDKEKLISQIRGLATAIKRINALAEQFETTDIQIFDALRLQLFRITSLGLSAFDTPDAQNVCEETANSLQSLLNIVEFYGEVPKDLNATVSKSLIYLKGKRFNELNQLSFTVDYLLPIGKQLLAFRKQLHIEGTNTETPLKADASNLFDKEIFVVNQMIDNKALHVSNIKIELGKKLFYDERLSDGNNRSCASCHRPELAFTDGLTVPQSLSAQKLKRNTPTLTYAGFQNAFFYDLNSPTLEDQALNVIHNKNEMGGSLKIAAVRLNNDQAYRKVFKKAFNFDTVQFATPAKIQNALAAYIRSLASFSSNFDSYMQGNTDQLTNEQKLGYNLYMGKARCGSCHFAPLFNGTPPPKFDRTEAEVLGVPKRPDTAKASVDTDLGRFALNPYPQYKYMFKTPTLRNISKTAPYMHNGAYKTLEQVMDFYNRGGGAGIGINLENQTLSSSPLNLTKTEIAAVIAFLKSLDDK